MVPLGSVRTVSRREWSLCPELLPGWARGGERRGAVIVTTVSVRQWGHMPEGVPKRTEGGGRDRETTSNSFKFSYKEKQRNGIVVEKKTQGQQGTLRLELPQCL